MPTPPLLPDEVPTTPEGRAEYLKVALETRDRAAIRAVFKAELLASPVFAAHMGPYNPRGFDNFAETYSSYKATIFLNGARALDSQADRFLQYRETAAKCLWEIQQKQLFDLQCQWRAEQLTLPGVRHSHDFDTWSRYIEHCPFLPPISADDVALYEAYLRSPSYDHEDVYDWQAYEDFKLSEDPDQQEEADNELPAWYDFHNARTGAGALLALPDVRGPKEARYVDQWGAEARVQQEEAEAGKLETEKLPWPPSCIGLDLIAPFLDLFEPAADLPRLHRWRRAVALKEKESTREREQADYWYSYVLQPAGEAWPIKAHADWRVALREAGIDYWRTQVADVLHEVWQEQEQNRALGLPVIPPDRPMHWPPFDQFDWTSERDWYGTAILRGRELAGEPRDFNF